MFPLYRKRKARNSAESHFSSNDAKTAIHCRAMTGWKRLIPVGAGAFLAAFGLEMFLTPNRIIPGGIHGLSSLLSHMTEMKMGLILFILNLPYVVYSSFAKERSRFFLTAFGFLLLSGITLILHPFPPLVEDPPLAALAGGVFLGIGAGLVLAYSGPMDGVQTAAYYMRKRLPLSTDELITLVNLVLLGLAGFIFGWDQAVYSVVTYAVAMTVTKKTTKLLHRYQAVWIRTTRPEAVRKALAETPGIGFLNPIHAAARPNELYLTIPKRQGEAVLHIVEQVDPKATMGVSPIQDMSELG
ncbi:YitT family protein [Paenibacillus sp. YN15]|uniref:YitT family protein n=1 Tax=Paenibacillus sp. YN15 TaxID=1742774 RepID=UPI000DCE10BA|nr:YitT family protein [Paenibacillus sp. YN15]RAU96153.1 hypothetical protein DQG13_21030 [Paenibacillus sp. YN15]